MNELLKKLIQGKVVSEQDIKDALYEICDDEHASCSSNCLVYEANGGEPVGSNDCRCFKNGRKMLNFLRENL